MLIPEHEQRVAVRLPLLDMPTASVSGAPSSVVADPQIAVEFATEHPERSAFPPARAMGHVGAFQDDKRQT
jgi:hypothetical protein